MDGEETWDDARELFEALHDHTGPDAYTAVLEPWLARAEGAYREELVEGVALLVRTTADGLDGRCQDPLWELYALSRVSDLLLLPCQPPGDPDEPSTATVTTAQYLELFGRLGMTPFEETEAFDPFLHEIVEVDQTEDPDEPIRITGLVWPGLRHGSLLFNRAGVRVRAGVRHAERGVADRSPLYWSHRRRHRPTVDLSQGWGHNSQWRTDFRVDLRTATGDEVNVCANGEGIDVPWTGALLTPDERWELLRHRCLLRTPVKAAEMAETPRWQEEFFPFGWRLPTA
ncbi:hypothetical protein ACQEWB_01310 [Streptomyces sp. CA-249302]|uniref:hypothetical protein n=1 Tax=Streptomyces sp. CA-249302 TaxID=3240058 RepID=UPI003D8FBD91